jgi:exopolysaccharide biosynthesis polyprenyl glycosylphosphotransferase
MSELSEVPPAVDPVLWLPSRAEDVESLTESPQPATARSLRSEILQPVPEIDSRSASSPVEDAPDNVPDVSPAGRVAGQLRPVAVGPLTQVVVVLGVALGYDALRGGSLPLSLALVGVVFAITVRSGRAAVGGARVMSAVHHLFVAYATVSLAVAVGAVRTEALPQAAVLFAAGGVVLAGTAFVRERRRAPLRVLVVGDRGAVSRAAMQWGASPRVEVVGGVLTDRPLGDGRPVSVVGVPSVAGVQATLGHLTRCRADVVLVSPGPLLSGADVRRLSWELEGTGVELGVLGGVDHAAPHRIQPVHVEGSTVLRLLPARPPCGVRCVKYVVDRVLGTLLLLTALPVIALLVLAVRLDSPGPGLFRQTRTGRDGKPFTIFKLRTMHRHADRDLVTLSGRNEADGPLFKIHDDPRVTRLGKILRRTSLDELPQLINVVRGEMSLVGPRPALPTEVASYDDVERRRLRVRPGLTGLWQVSGRSDLGWDSGMALDLRYADNWRLRADASILARTVGAVVRRRGAY